MVASAVLAAAASVAVAGPAAADPASPALDDASRLSGRVPALRAVGARVPEACALSPRDASRVPRRVASELGARSSSIVDVDLTAAALAPSGKSTSGLPADVRERIDWLTDPFAMRAGGRGAAQEAPGGASRSAHRDPPWATPRLLADATNMNDEYVSVQACPTSGNLYVTFQAYDLGGTDRDIHIARSTDDGATWQVWEMPSFTEDEYHSELAIDAAGYLYVTWIRDDGVIVRTRSSNPDDPLTWEWVKGLTTGETCATPTIAVSGSGDFSTVFIASSWLTINWDLYVYEWTLIWMYSTNGGSTVTYDYFVPDGYPDTWPDAELDGAMCYLVNGEQDYYTGIVEILVAADAVSGGFTSPVYLTDWTDMNCGFPILAAEDEKVHVVYQLDYDDGLGNIDGDVIYCYSWDACATVYGPYSIVDDEYESVGPVVYTRDGIVGCLWLDAPPNGDEFYLCARQAGSDGHPDAWGTIETVTYEHYVEPTFRSDAGTVGDGLLHAVWIDRRDFPTQGLNVYTSERPVLPNLTEFTPSGWGGPLVANMIPGERTTGILAADDSVYVSFAFWNDGLADVEEDFLIRLTIDDAEEAAWILSGGLAIGWYVTIEDYVISVGAGPHDIGFEVDFSDTVAESNELDNVHEETLEFIDGDAILRCSPGSITHVVESPALPRGEIERVAREAPLARRYHVPVVDERLADALAVSGARERHRVVIVAGELVDAPELARRIAELHADDRRAVVIEALKDRSRGFRAELDPLIGELRAAGDVTEPQELWLSGALVVEATPAGVSALAGHPAVGRLWLDDVLSEPHLEPGAAAASGGRERALAWHLTTIGADEAWSGGHDGDGVIVGHLDSGVAYDHADLAGAMWDGSPTYPNHGWDCLDEDDDPYDGDTADWHGTHTAGLVVGDGTSGTTTGAAPGARLMALRCVPGYQADMTEGLQFAMDNGAHIVTMSAGWSVAGDALREANRTNAEVLLAAGIPWIASAGNGDNAGGHYPVPTDISSPGDCPSPWYGSAGHAAVIGVGATDAGDAVWSDSSYGPTEWNITTTPGYDDYPYPPGLMKPDIAAPGVNVTSTTLPSGYVAYSGTSMSAPLVAGAGAVLIGASPGVTPEALAEALETGALDIGSAGRDNSAGAGRLDIPAALAALPDVESATFYVINDGVIPLIVHDVAWKEQWLGVTPLETVVDPGDSVRFTATFDVEGLADGRYFDLVLFGSNDPASPGRLPVLLVVGSSTGVPAGESAAARRADLASYPNPFNPATVIRFAHPQGGRATVSVFGVDGRLVRTLIDEELPAGRHEVRWDGRTETGSPAASGVYFVRFSTGGTVASRKVTLLK